MVVSNIKYLMAGAELIRYLFHPLTPLQPSAQLETVDNTSKTITTTLNTFRLKESMYASMCIDRERKRARLRSEILNNRASNLRLLWAYKGLFL
ncbi:hypothetical protein Hanom_Chr03g00248961 [Helianthus anomalus]